MRLELRGDASRNYAVRCRLLAVERFAGKGNRPRILVVEDETLMAIVWESMIFEYVRQADVVVTPTVASAEHALLQPHFDFAFLDVNLTDGKSYRIAAILQDHCVPFAFISGISRDQDIPARLRHVPFIPKPYQPSQVTELLRNLA
jgi:DNA-binding LytR/AlgR family response regulator